MASECVVGLDIGTTKICAVAAEIDDDGKVKIVGCGSAVSSGLRRGVVIDIDEAAASIEKAVDSLRESCGYEIHSAVVGVTGDHIASLNSRGILAVTHASREIEQEDVDRVVEQSRVIVLPPDREIIHVIPRSFTVDGQPHVRFPVGMAGSRLEVESHVVTGSVTLLQNLVKAVNKAGISVESAVLESIASAEAALTPAEKNLGVALLDIGGGTTDLAVFVDGDIVYSGSIPIGGALVTRDISIGLRVAPEEAERIKLTYGAAVYSALPGGDYDTFEATAVDGKVRSVARKHLTEIIGPRMEEIFTVANQKIEKSGYYNYLLAGIVLTGGGALLPGAAGCCSDVAGLSARIGSMDSILYLPDSLSSVIHATGLGLALHAARRPRTVFARKVNDEPMTIRIGQHVETCVRKIHAFLAKIMGFKPDD